jgi:hypothetical protein
MLARDWSTPKLRNHLCLSHHIHSFGLVILLEAKDLMHNANIVQVIVTKLLGEDSKVPPAVLLRLVAEEKTLIMIDHYDEACRDNILAQELIDGRIHDKATVLVSMDKQAHQLKPFFDAYLSFEEMIPNSKKLF